MAASGLYITLTSLHLYIIFKVYSLLTLTFLLWFATFHPKCSKNRPFKKIYVLREKSSDIASFLEHRVYSNFKMYSVLILVFFILICPYSFS